jgi:small conductance mechanosensitive channel
MLGYVTALWDLHYAWILDIAYKGALTFFVALSSYFVAKALRKSVDRANDRFDRLDPTLVPVLNAVASYTVYALGVVIVLDVFGVNTTSIIAVLGAAALAIGLALKDTLGNIAAGIMLLILRPFRVDDLIQCDSMLGTVKETGLFTTILETLEGQYICAPNAILWNAPITNFTRNDRRRMDIVVGISYSDSIDKGLEVLSGVVRDEPRFLSDPVPQVMVKALSDSSVDLQIRAWTSFNDYWSTFWDQNKRVKEQIEAAGLTIPFPQRDVHVISGNQPQ